MVPTVPDPEQYLSEDSRLKPGRRIWPPENQTDPIDGIRLKLCSFKFSRAIWQVTSDDEFKEWLEDDWDAESFNLIEVNASLKETFKPRKKDIIGKESK